MTTEPPRKLISDIRGVRYGEVLAVFLPERSASRPRCTAPRC